MRLRLNRNPDTRYFPVDVAAARARVIMQYVYLLRSQQSTYYYDFKDLFIDATMFMNKGITSSKAPAAEVASLREESRIYAKRVFDSLSNLLRSEATTNPDYEPLPLDAALGLVKAILSQVDMLLQVRPEAYSDWNEVLIDAAMNLRTGFTSLDAPEEELPELLEDNRMFAKNVFASVASALDFQANTNPSPSGFTMATAKFPGQNCAACGGEFVPGITEIEVDPDRVGPKGGKKYVHSNPNECMAHSNPYAATNAGNRMKWDADAAGGARSVPKPGRPAPLPRPRGPQAGKDLAYVHAQDLLGMSARDLAQMTTSSLEGVASAVAGELERRGRTKSGRKTAWGEGPAPKFANVKARA